MFDFLAEKFSALLSPFHSKKRLDQKSMQEALVKVEDALFEADVPYQVVKDFIGQVEKTVAASKLLEKIDAGTVFIKLVHDELKSFLGNQNDFAGFQIPSIIMSLGLQGSGKTTSLAKMALYARLQAESRGKKRRIVCASVDFYRPAAIDQLELLAGKIEVDFYRSKKTSPVEAAQDCLQFMRMGGYELLFLDTAGRLQTDAVLMRELKEIDSLLKPRYKIFMLDAMTGQESLHVAQAFDKEVGFHAAMLTKTDSDSKGGAGFAFKYVQKKPIFFVGTGEKPEDMELFYPDRMAGRILGMGDVVTLAEKAEKVINQESRQALDKAFTKGTLTLQDFADQIGLVHSLGSLSTVSKYLPGMGSVLNPAMIQQGERDIKKFKAIISSMTLKERLMPTILNGSRLQRIARGSGVSVSDIKLLLSRFEESKQYAKMLKRFFRTR